MADEYDFDAFFSHNSADAEQVERLAKQLLDEHRLRVFFDRWDMVPGNPAIPALEQALERSRAVVVFVGLTGLGPWHELERQAAIRSAVHRGSRVVPALLDGAKEEELPGFLQGMTCVELAHGDGFLRLVAGITGRSPGALMGIEGPGMSASASTRSSRGAAPKVAPTRLPPPACPIFGRDDELARLDAAWDCSGADQTNVVTLVAWGGVGKTALLFEWMNRLGREGW
ncbi:MAG: toll/interleukin-1 receptor domain-containing protein, partial [Nannocystaceae bacterium]